MLVRGSREGRARSADFASLQLSPKLRVCSRIELLRTSRPLMLSRANGSGTTGAARNCCRRHGGKRSSSRVLLAMPKWRMSTGGYRLSIIDADDGETVSNPGTREDARQR